MSEEQPIAPPHPEVAQEAPKESAQPRDKGGRFASVLQHLEANTKLTEALKSRSIDPADYDPDLFSPEEFQLARNSREKRGIHRSAPPPPSDPHKLLPEPEGDVSFEDFSRLREKGLTGLEPEGEPGAPEKAESEAPAEQSEPAAEQQRIAQAKNDEFVRSLAIKSQTSDPQLAEAIDKLASFNAPAPLVDAVGVVLSGLPRGNGSEVLKVLAQGPGLLQLLSYQQTPEAFEVLIIGISDEIAAAQKPTSKPKVTAAPPPPQPVVTRNAMEAFNVNDETLSPERWALERNRQLAAGRRRR